MEKWKACLAVILLILIASQTSNAGTALPYIQDFDGITVGTEFAEWSGSNNPPLGEVLGVDSQPFGVDIPFDDNYLFMSGSQGASGSIGITEPTESLVFSCSFSSVPNPDFITAGAFRGGASFKIHGESEYPRAPYFGVEVHGEMWLEPDALEVEFQAGYFDDGTGREVALGTIEHGQVYDLIISLKPNLVSVQITGLSTNIFYELPFNNSFLAKDVSLWEGSYPPNEYGVAIDNVNITPEPATIALILLGSIFCRKK